MILTEIKDTAEKVYEWRLSWLRAGGFSLPNARRIADSHIDWRYANKLLENCKAKGHTEEFVMELLF